MSSLRQKTKDPKQRVLIYTVVPPPVDASSAEIEARLEALQRLLYDIPIDAINLPEVRPELRSPRVSRFVPKREPRSFALLIEEQLDPRAPVIVDRAVVYTHWGNQERWLLKTWREYKIRNLVLVGGESSRVRYPGPSVAEAAQLIRSSSVFGDFLLGGITIPGRSGEPERLIEKAKSGIEFFISQIIYESEPAKSVLKDYLDLCRKEGLRPRRIFLSFAPISSEHDVKFLRGWSVKIPEPTERFLMKSASGIVERSIEAAERVLEEILEFVDMAGVEIPLGLNLEHVNQRNWAGSRDLGIRLLGIYDSVRARRPKRTGAKV